jgi:hypothetical protein
MLQTFGTTTVRILRTQHGGRFAEIRPERSPAYRVPAELLPLAAGKDAWMRDIQLRCAGCDSHHRAADMASGLYCPACVEAQEEENARLDGRADA